MQIVIELDKKDFEIIRNGCSVPIAYDNHIYDAIRKGTPLPKGHGRLKDVDDIYDNCTGYHTDDDGSSCFKWIDIDIAPTIVGAEN